MKALRIFTFYFLVPLAVAIILPAAFLPLRDETVSVSSSAHSK